MTVRFRTVGDNVANEYKAMPWYKGGNLLNYMENVEIRKQLNAQTKFNVQFVIGHIQTNFTIAELMLEG